MENTPAAAAADAAAVSDLDLGSGIPEAKLQCNALRKIRSDLSGAVVEWMRCRTCGGGQARSIFDIESIRGFSKLALHSGHGRST